MKPVKVQVDASLRGLGACLIQEFKGEDQPITFTSKSLTDAETRYANIERELLAIVFACQRFSTLFTQKKLYCREQPQTTGNDRHEESHQHATPSAEDVTRTLEIRCHHQVQTRTTDATGQRFKLAAQQEPHRRSN